MVNKKKGQTGKAPKMLNSTNKIKNHTMGITKNWVNPPINKAVGCLSVE